MENKKTTPNEPQNDIYELLRKVVETNEESIKSTKQTESVHLERLSSDTFSKCEGWDFGNENCALRGHQPPNRATIQARL